MLKVNVNVREQKTMLRVACLSIILCICGSSLVQAAPAQAHAKNEAAIMLKTARYLSSVYQKVYAAWKIKGIPFMELHRRSATLRFWVKANGQLARIRVVQASGHKRFDLSLLRAVTQALPFAKPPHAIRSTVLKEGLEILFRRRVFKKKTLPLNTKYKGKMVLGNWQKKRVQARKPKKRK